MCVIVAVQDDLGRSWAGLKFALDVAGLETRQTDFQSQTTARWLRSSNFVVFTEAAVLNI